MNLQILCLAGVLLLMACNTTKKTSVVETTPNIEMIEKDIKMKMSEIVANTDKFEKPSPRKEAYPMEMHGDTRVDDYYWMRLTDEQKNAEKLDPHTQEVVDYLEAENTYVQGVTGGLDAFKDKLYNEMIGRIKQTDMSVPYKSNGYFYISRYEEGGEYPIHSRKKDNLEADEEIMLDVNIMADGHDYFAIGGRSVSPNNQLLAYGVDTVSRRIYEISFKDLRTGETLTDLLKNTTGSAVWGNDNKTIFYTQKDEALRSYKIFRHTLGTPQEQDVEVYHEADETFNAFVYKTKSKKYIMVGSWATLSNEYYSIPADDPTAEMTLFQARERKLEYSVNHYGDNWYVLTNKDGAKNFKLMITPEGATSQDNWKEYIEHRDDVLLSGVDIFKDYLVLSERANGLTQIKVQPWDKSPSHIIDFGESVYTAYTSVNLDFDTEIMRIGYTSMTTPSTTYDYNIKERILEVKKQQEVVGGYNPADYVGERIMVDARDGTKVPVSLVYKKGFKKDGTAPVLLYGYGSYGNSIDPYFSSVRLSLMNRGFAFAIAHIRGGQEMGRQWYEDGKFLKKKNTFTDFIDCGRQLIASNYAADDQLYAMGGSAGGLLMGAVMNMAPDLWNGVIAAVPFVDVVTTMLDETIPLTTGEYDEWGNPNDKEYYDYIKTYSPYDNVKAIDYPATLVTTGYHDSQVQYWEPAKWVAKLRELKTDNNPLLFHVNMEAGHGGKSGRFARYKEIALEYAFLLDLAGKVDED